MLSSCRAATSAEGLQVLNFETDVCTPSDTSLQGNMPIQPSALRQRNRDNVCLLGVDSGCCQALTVWPVSSVARSLDWRTIDSASELDLAWLEVQRVPLWSVRFRVAGRIGQQAVPPPVLLA